MNFSNSYAALDEIFYQRIQPVPVIAPKLFLWNDGLARQLMIPSALKHDISARAKMFSGNEMIFGSESIATAYAGHQFGRFVPQLGDGRAHLLGEVIDENGHRWDIQLKGSGRTAFSRGGDGRCALGPAIREFIMSEAMHALGVPTTRGLAVVTTGETVFRDRLQPGAVATRVASSHLRIGTFQFFAARGDHKALETLCNYTIERHYPELHEERDDQYVRLIDKVIERQIHLVVEWMRIGFIHGVMNTDNTSLAGETIDYGPCAMMGIYNPQTVYSSIDTMGRYAFGNQPNILHWNMARFAECLLPLIDRDENKAVDLVAPLITDLPRRFENAFMAMMGKKLGLTSIQKGDKELIQAMLNRFEERQMDYTITFDRLTRSLTSEAEASQMHRNLSTHFSLWQQRLHEQTIKLQAAQALMRQHNPLVIPRNHHVEAVLRECEQTGKATSAQKFLQVLRSPYEALPQTSEYQDPPADGDKDYRTFCGT
jgi:uncharacterized protein YdiU (UPF0061 family)